ncbi:DOPA 4,5-dioxygenase [Pseudoxanthomonas sp. GM95]|nr:DOPA 4,5-dioxygenase [Pseudoxanthomonas sp. GM95]
MSSTHEVSLHPQDEEHAHRLLDRDGNLVRNAPQDQSWADLLSPARRRLIAGAGLAASGLAIAGNGTAAAQVTGQNFTAPNKPGFRAIVPPPDQGKSPWGEHTAEEPATQPRSVRPGEKTLPAKPRAYTDVKSYHAHIYFDDDTYAKAALIRRWTIERFPVELGNWNLEPRGPHVTPSFYFGFTNDLLPVLVPWLQLNSLGLTILLHPNTGDERADHLYYALWVNRSQPVNGYQMPDLEKGGEPHLERIYPNIVPTVVLET